MMNIPTSSNPLPYQIEPATWRDLGALRRLEQECFPLDAWPLLDLIAVLSFSNIVRLKAILNDEMIGFIAGDLRRGQDLAWIATIGVLPVYQRQGIASALLQACEAQLQTSRVRLSLRINNQPARLLYESAGYYQVGIWPEYYNDKTDALVMEKHL